MKSKISILSMSALMLVLPVLTHAQTVEAFILTIRGWLGLLLPMAISLGVLAFFWGLAKYLLGGAEDKGKGLSLMMMGILAVFIMASLGGLVSILQKTTGATNNDTIKGPCIVGCDKARGGRIRNGVAG